MYCLDLLIFIIGKYILKSASCFPFYNMSKGSRQGEEIGFSQEQKELAAEEYFWLSILHIGGMVVISQKAVVKRSRKLSKLKVDFSSSQIIAGK